MVHGYPGVVGDLVQELPHRPVQVWDSLIRTEGRRTNNHPHQAGQPESGNIFTLGVPSGTRTVHP